MAMERNRQRQAGRSRLGFNGELLETVAGHYLLGNGYRAYSTVLLCFLQPDSWSPFGGGGFNAYAYCKGDPVNSSDPTGHMPLPLRKPSFHLSSMPPPASPIRPGRPESALPVNQQASQMFGEFLQEGMAPGTSLAGSSARSPSSTVSVVNTTVPELPWFSRRKGLRINVEDIEKLRTKVDGMVESRDAKGLIELAGEKGRGNLVLEQLFRTLQLPQSTRSAMVAKHGDRPRLQKKQVGKLMDEALGKRMVDDAVFYAELRGIFDIKSRRTPRAHR